MDDTNFDVAYKENKRLAPSKKIKISRGRRVLSPLQLKKGTSSIQLSQLNLKVIQRVELIALTQINISIAHLICVIICRLYGKICTPFLFSLHAN